VNNLEWQRSKVLELSSQGYTQSEIAKTLQVSQPSVNRDLTHLTKQAQDNLQKHIHETVPEEYQKCMVGMKRNVKHVLQIGEAASDPKVKLQAVSIANDCYKLQTKRFTEDR
jgi:predicted transcriptional regulator